MSAVSPIAEHDAPIAGGHHRWGIARSNTLISSAAIIMLAHLPLVLLLAAYQWSRPHYQCFPIVIAGFVFFVITRFQATEPKTRPSRLSWAMLLLGMILLMAGVVLFSPWLAGVSMIMVTGSLLLYLTGRYFYADFLGPWALLWLIVPLPLQGDIHLISWLQAETSAAAGTVLDLMGIRHLMSGNVLEFPGTTMLVEEACSGVHSLFALLALVGLFVVWARRPAIHSILLLLSVGFWSALTNFLRVLTVAVAYERFDINLASGWIHDAVGVIFFGFALLMIASTDQFLMWTRSLLDDLSWLPLTKSERERKQAQRRRHRKKQASIHAAEKNRRGNVTNQEWASPVVVGIFALLAVIQLGEFAFATTKHLGRPKRVATIGEQAFLFDEQSLPATHNDWHRVSYEFIERRATNSLGPNSKIWKYQTPTSVVAVSLDYPFTDWHELSYCYGGQGWQLQSRRTSEAAGLTTPDSEIPFVELVLRKPTGEHGYVLFTLMDDSGAAVPPPDPSLSTAMRNRVVEGPLARVFGHQSRLNLNANTYQVQVFAASDKELDERQREEIRHQFLSFAEIIRRGQEQD